MKTLLNTFAALLLVAGAVQAADPAGPRLKPGDKAPMVEGKDQDGKDWKLSEALARHVVLVYFYPKDDTPGCTKEACGLRDRMSDLKKDNVEVVGVSFDNGDSHKKFISKYSLNFPLLTDTEGKLADAYGVRMADRNMARRVSYLIGQDGKILHVTDNPKAEVHLEEMKDAVARVAKK